MTPASAHRRADPQALFARPNVVAERKGDGSIWLTSATPLQSYARCAGDWLEQWAREAPETIFLAERASADAPWITLTYRGALRRARAVASWILAQGMSAERPVAILSDNSVDHAIFMLAAMHAGVPAASVSPAYSLVSKDFDKLKSMIALLDPGARCCRAAHPNAKGSVTMRAATGSDVHRDAGKRRIDPFVAWEGAGDGRHNVLQSRGCAARTRIS